MKAIEHAVARLARPGIATVCEAFGVTIHHMSARRYVHEIAQALMRNNCWKSVRVMGLDVPRTCRLDLDTPPTFEGRERRV